MTDFGEVLREALREAGCDDSRFSFDAHSPITMAFTDVDDFTFVPEDDAVVLWHEMAGVSISQVLHVSRELIEEMLAPVDYLHAGSLNLRLEGESIWMGGQLHADVRNDGKLLCSALADFHERVTRIRASLK